MADEIILTENVNHPGQTYPRDARKYRIARDAMLAFLPTAAPGLTQSEMTAAMKTALAEKHPDIPPGWWMKTVQLDLEAKGLVVREKVKPLRWHRK